MRDGGEEISDLSILDADVSEVSDMEDNISEDASDLKSENQTEFWEDGRNRVVEADILVGQKKIFNMDFQKLAHEEFMNLNDLVSDEDAMNSLIIELAENDYKKKLFFDHEK